MLFPDYRPRRMRQRQAFRKMVRETVLSVNDFILPLFAVDGKGIKAPIDAMPGQYHYSIDNLVKVARQAFNLGVPAIILFGIPSKKDPLGTQAYAKDGIVQRAIREVKNTLPELALITDVCLCQYTDHGHCGFAGRPGPIDNDGSVWTFWPARPCPMPNPVPTWWRPRT
jgi:porphobilinogen synthase